MRRFCCVNLKQHVIFTFAAQMFCVYFKWPVLHVKTLLNKFFSRKLFLLTGGSVTDLVLWTFTHQGRWVPVRAPQTVPQCEVLAVVVLKEQVVVGVVGGAIDDTGQSGGHAVVAIVD